MLFKTNCPDFLKTLTNKETPILFRSVTYYRCKTKVKSSNYSSDTIVGNYKACGHNNLIAPPISQNA